MLRRLGRVEHVWYTIWHVLLLRQWHLRSSYVSIRMSGGAPVVVTTMDTLAELRRSAHQAVHILAERRGPSAERVEVSCQRWRVSVAHRRGCRWVAPAASGHTLKSDRLFNSKSSKRTNPRLDTINRRGGERVRFVGTVAIRTVDIYVHAQIRDCRYRERSIHR
jgi:hypothetical protein